MTVRRVTGGSAEPDREQSDVAAAAKAATEFFAYGLGYCEHLEREILPLRKTDPRKDRQMARRVLANLHTLVVLQFIWKESRFVPVEVLRRLGIRRQALGGPLTVHGLTMILCDGNTGASAALRRVTNIVRIGKDYGLLEINRIHDNMIEIAATKRLDELMHAVYVRQALKLPPPQDEEDDE